jgi:glucose/mannose-6-phosphate isomerase
MMDQLIERFPAQLREAISMGDEICIHHHDSDIHHILVAGMGNSGIGARFVADFIRDECTLPLLVVQDYEAPAFLTRHTLAIASSYSGETEEVCAIFEKMVESRSKVVVIASGGELLEKAIIEGVDYIELPADCPSPRVCVGYSIVQQLFVLYKLSLISDEKIRQIADASTWLDQEMKEIKKEAMQIAEFIFEKTPVLYASSSLEAAVLRWRQQINQNAKLLCWHHSIPEMNHNELIGWRQENENLAVLFLRSLDDHPRNQKRIELSQEIIQGYTNATRDIVAKGKTLVEQSLYLLHLGDWVSVYLAKLNGVDPMKMKVADYFKKELGRAF